MELLVNEDRMVDQLLLHEGEKLTPYLDTLGNWTVGTGYNLDARGVEFLNSTLGTHFTQDDHSEHPFASVRLTQAQSRLVLRADLRRFEAAVKVHFPEYLNLDEVRRRVILDMAFNLGFRALGFKAAIAAIKARNFSQAARELYKSKWAYQVGDGEGKKFDRCDRLSRMLLTGEDYTT
jgi:lysozyme